MKHRIRADITLKNLETVLRKIFTLVVMDSMEKNIQPEKCFGFILVIASKHLADTMEFATRSFTNEELENLINITFERIKTRVFEQRKEFKNGTKQRTNVE